MLEIDAMLARCPGCSQRFPIVGSCQTSCPFCGVTVQVSVERLKSGSASRSSRRIFAKRARSGQNTHGPITIETLAEADVQNLAAEEALGFLEHTRREALRQTRAAEHFPVPPSTPWESPYGGRGRAWWETVKSASLSPRRFFIDLSADAIEPALTFLALVTLPAVFAHGFSAHLVASWLGVDASRFPAAAPLTGYLALFVPLALLYYVAMYHATATLFSQRRLRISGVVRATCYGFAPLALAVVPGVGLAVGLAWSLVLHYHALRRHLGLVRYKAVIALSMPLVPVIATLALDRLVL